jgi:hypothetical protein
MKAQLITDIPMLDQACMILTLRNNSSPFNLSHHLHRAQIATHCPLASERKV